MKRILFLLMMSLSAFLVTAQKYEDIKNQLVFNKYKEAKVDLDKAWSNAKFISKAEAYILKTSIYAWLALEDGTKGTPAGDQLTADAELAFAKYKEMEPSMELATDPIYQNGPINLYSSLYGIAYKDYDGKKWETAYEKFKKTLTVSDLLIEKKLVAMPLDTVIVYFTASSAENSKHFEEAAKLYTRLTDAKVNTDWAETAYRFMVRYSFEKNDMAGFEKYRSLGQQMYPKSEYFKYDKIDFAAGLKDNLKDKIAALEGILAKEPDNYKANESLGEIIYSAFYPRKDEDAEPYSKELEAKMIAAFTKAGALRPDSINLFLLLGDHFVNRKDKISEERQAHADDMKARTKPGTMASKEDIAKRDLLDKQYLEAMDAIRGPYEQAAKIFAGKSALDPRQKQQYRNLAGYLSELYELKKKRAKAKSPEQAAFEAEEKKWYAVYESIK